MSEPKRAEKTRPPAPTQPAQDYNAMDTAPKDGKRIVVTDGKGRTDVVAWRTTRQFDRQLGTWVKTEFWAKQNAHGQLDFEPVGWVKEW